MGQEGNYWNNFVFLLSLFSSELCPCSRSAQSHLIVVESLYEIICVPSYLSVPSSVSGAVRDTGAPRGRTAERDAVHFVSYNGHTLLPAVHRYPT